MQVISRDQLTAVLTGPVYDPEGQFAEEMLAFATAILADAPATTTHFVFTDSENGDDQEVTFGEHAQVTKRCLIGPMEYNRQGNGYYGLVATRKDFYSPDDPRVQYDCYMGGSPASSAPGFVLSGATMAD